jgi:tRNA(Ile2)-agmatinylcytidine synthase
LTATIFCEPPVAIVVPATYLGFDDTDSPDGMCTTFLATLMLSELGDCDLLGLPRLVRLNPNVPWKTRGNAAVCLPLGHGVGPSRPCGEIDGKPLRYYSRGTPTDPHEVLRVATTVLEGVAELGCDNTNPGIVVTNRALSQKLYWRAVREVVPIMDVERELRAAGAVWRGFKNGRGVIGAASSISWRPHDRTWEVVSYREASRIGTKRDISSESVVRMDQETKSTFHNYDPENEHVAICPASPCPVLFGIRGDDPEELFRARIMIEGERPRSWLLYLTNQGTDDHITRRRVRALRPGMSARVRAMVTETPRSIEGGHVIVRVTDGQEVDVAFYEPSGDLNRASRRLLPGDEIEVFGSVRASPRSLNAEKLFVSHLVPALTKRANPMCRECGKRMGSLGAGQGYRCKVCGAKAPRDAAEMTAVDRGITPGWYEPPVSSRRHLYKPVRRMSRANINNLL